MHDPAPEPNADRHAALVRHLAAFDEACPGCGYNLRGATGAACPECGRGIALGIAGAARPRASDRAGVWVLATLLIIYGLYTGGYVGWFLIRFANVPGYTNAAIWSSAAHALVQVAAAVTVLAAAIWAFAGRRAPAVREARMVGLLRTVVATAIVTTAVAIVAYLIQSFVW